MVFFFYSLIFDDVRRYRTDESFAMILSTDGTGQIPEILSFGAQTTKERSGLTGRGGVGGGSDASLH